jgi:DNA-binding protein H-NS
MENGINRAPESWLKMNPYRPKTEIRACAGLCFCVKWLDRLAAIISFNHGRIAVALKTMPISKLLELRAQIEAALATKVSEQRRALETELAKLSRFEPRGTRSKYFGRGLRGKVAPKYRNPENPTETWAGRGLRPRWLTAAIKSGKKLDDFSIGTSSPSKRGLRGLPGEPNIGPPKPIRRVPKK